MANPAVDTDFKIAIFPGGPAGLVTLRSIGVTNPYPLWKGGVDLVDLGDNSARIIGAPYLVWQWGFLQDSQRNTLRGYCQGGSAPVYIVTPTTEVSGPVSNVAKTYAAQMIWPAPRTPEAPQTGRRLEFSIIFRQLVLQS